MSERPSTYTVQSGDTLSGIAAQFYGDENLYQWIADANGIADANAIDVGQEITLPMTDEETTAAAQAESEAAAAAASTAEADAATTAQAATDKAAADAAAAAAAADKAAADKAAEDKHVADEVDAERYRMQAKFDEEKLEERMKAAEAAKEDADFQKRAHDAANVTEPTYEK